MIAGLELEDDLQQLIKFFNNWFKVQMDHSYDMTDVIATTNINVHCTKKLKTVFPGRKRLVETKNEEHEQGTEKFIPGVGRVRIVPNYDWDD